MRHSHRSAAVKAPVDKRAPNTTPVATLLARLFVFFFASSHVGERVKRSAFEICARLPPSHSFRAPPCAISGDRIQKLLPYPILAIFSRFGSISLRTHWQGLSSRSSLSFSPFAFFFSKTPELITIRLVCIAAAKLPTPEALPEPLRAFHPIWHVCFGPGPACRI